MSSRRFSPSKKDATAARAQLTRGEHKPPGEEGIGAITPDKLIKTITKTRVNINYDVISNKRPCVTES